MPARSNAFQRLIRAIQGNISRAGTVQESRMMHDKDTGSLVEVDIVIEENVAGHQILIGIECTSGKRKATIEWYREMLGKHSSLPISKTVLVSESGFTREVHKKSRKDNVSLMTPTQAEDYNWKSLFSKLKGGTIADVGFMLRSIDLTFHEPCENLDLNNISAKTEIHIDGHHIPLGQLALMAAKESDLTRKIMHDLPNIIKKTDQFYFSVELPSGSSILIDGNMILVKSIKATFSIRPRYQHIDWKPINVNGKTFAAGTFKADFLFPGATGETVLTVSHGASGEFKVKMLDPDDNDIELESFPNALHKKCE